MGPETDVLVSCAQSDSSTSSRETGTFEKGSGPSKEREKGFQCVGPLLNGSNFLNLDYLEEEKNEGGGGPGRKEGGRGEGRGKDKFPFSPDSAVTLPDPEGSYGLCACL